MGRWINRAAGWYWGLTLLVLGVGVVSAIDAPVDAAAGPIQKLIYLHLPVAANTFLAALVVCVGSVGYLSGRRQLWDNLAHAAAAVTVLNGTVLLLTGMFWARVVWGQWWVWSPRLTFSLILWCLYAGYLFIRARIGAAERRAVVSSIYGIVAFLDVPLLYLSVKLMPDVHPTGGGLTAGMYTTLWIWLAGLTMLSLGIMGLRYRLAQTLSLRDAAGNEALKTGAMP